MAAQIQQWFHSSTAKMSFLQTATARYYLNWKLLWGNISIERGTLQIYYKNTFRANLSEFRYPFWVDYCLTCLTTTNFYGQPMFESRNICDLGLLQNARTHGPRGTVKTIERYFLHRTQVHYFCSGNSNQDLAWALFWRGSLCFSV